MSEKKQWNDVYSLPFRLDETCYWVYDSKGNFIFQFEKVIPSEMRNTLAVLNKERETINKTASLKYENGEVLITPIQKPIITIRGWGYLTGIGGLNLSEEQALNIQDSLGKYIVERLNIRT